MASQLPKKKRIVFALVTAVLGTVATVFLGETFVRLASPVPYMFPRYNFSTQYGFTVFENREMVHERPGKWKFTYTVNGYQYRGPVIPVSNSYDKTNVVILGDSFSFGMGVNDGEEYPRIMATELQEEFDVINLGMNGWGLTQETRRYYEFGQVYMPRVVILQFCTNDPSDNFNSLVSTVENGKFIFHDVDNKVHLVKQYLSDSFIQKSQVYNFFRDRAYEYFVGQVVITRKQEMAGEQGTTIPVEQDFYNTLLEAFAKDLASKNVRLLMIAVENQLETFPYIRDKVKELDAKGYLKYYEVMDWLRDMGDYSSPEGHHWGKEAHRVVGLKLAEIIRKDFPSQHRVAHMLVRPEERTHMVK